MRVLKVWMISWAFFFGAQAAFACKDCIKDCEGCGQFCCSEDFTCCKNSTCILPCSSSENRQCCCEIACGLLCCFHAPDKMISCATKTMLFAGDAGCWVIFCPCWLGKSLFCPGDYSSPAKSTSGRREDARSVTVESK